MCMLELGTYTVLLDLSSSVILTDDNTSESKHKDDMFSPYSLSLTLTYTHPLTQSLKCQCARVCLIEQC